jgi:hypothetical protein
MTEGADLQKARRQLMGIATRIDEIGNERRRMIELYASDQIARDAYINANVALDAELDDLKRKKAEIAEVLPTSGLEEVDEAVRKFCERAGTDLQQKEGTIESQLATLRRQIRAAGHELVKEYIDDGYTGTLLSRPGLDQLRIDLKGDVFDAIHFLAAGRQLNVGRATRTGADVRKA